MRPVTINLVPARLNLKKILVPIDFSEESYKALRYALRFAEQFGARLTLIHVVEPVVVPPELGYSALEMPMLNPAIMVKDARKKLAALIEKEARPPFAADSVVRRGSPFNEIAAVARETNADLIIIATHGYTGLKHLFLGSTAEKVVRHAPCPVLTVRSRQHDFVRRLKPPTRSSRYEI